MVLSPAFTVSQTQVQLSAAAPLRTQWVDVTGAIRPHDHAYHEICLITAGSAVHQTAGGHETIQRLNAIVVPPGAVHGFQRSGDLSVVNVYYLAEWLAADLGLLWDEPGLVPLFLSRNLVGPVAGEAVASFRLTEAELAAIATELHDIDAELSAAATSAVILRAAFLKVLARLARACSRTVPWAGSFRPEVWAVIHQIEKLIPAGEPFDAAALADRAGLSPDYLGKLFNTAMGRSMSDYYQARRVQYACRLLLDRQHPVTDIAMELGYSDTAHFSRMFKRYRGLSPRDYRAMYAPVAERSSPL